MKANSHKCQENKECTCSTQALEPDEECPIHCGARPYPKRCCICGRFINEKSKKNNG